MRLKFHHAFDNTTGTYNVYGLATLPEGVEILNPKTPSEMENKLRIKWSGETAVPPAIGARVYVEMNSMGAGTVLGYFIEYHWLGLHVKLDVTPDWLIKQDKDRRKNGRRTFYPNQALLFGCDLDEQTRVQ